MTKQCVQDVSADRLLLLYVINHSCQQCHHFYITLLSFLFMLLALILLLSISIGPRSDPSLAMSVTN